MVSTMTIYKWPEEIPWEAYIRIYYLENTLRRLVVDKLSNITSKWWKRRVPEEVRKRAEERKEEIEKQLVRPVDLDPISYVDFGDYIHIITKNDNWEEAFGSIFESKDHFRVALEKLVPVRNKIAHMRPINPRERKNLDALSEDIFTPIWERVFNVKYVRPAEKLMKMGKYHKAEGILVEGFHKTGDPYIAYKLGELYVATQRLEKAKELFEYARKSLALPRYKDLVTEKLLEVEGKIELGKLKTCLKCGSKVPEEYLYCGKCGRKFRARTEASYSNCKGVKVNL